MRPPKWTIDEVILTVDAYFKIGSQNYITNNNPFVVELSSLLKSLPIHNTKLENFRNLDGIRLTIGNLATLDENAVSKIGKSTKLQQIVYEYYFHHKPFLSALAAAIRNCLPLPFPYYEPLDGKEFMGGNILYLFHLYIENKTPAAVSVKKDMEKRLKGICSLCGIDLNKLYGASEGCKLLELHYSESPAAYRSSMTVSPRRLEPLCPCCHKLAHSSPFYMFNFSILSEAVSRRNFSV